MMRRLGRADGVSTVGESMAMQVVAPAGGARGDLVIRHRRLADPAEGEVRIEVRAAGVNPADWKSTYGTWPRHEDHPLGFEAAGVVVASGPGQSPSQVGDEVIAYLVFGAYASDMNVRADDLIRKPSALDFPQAANLFLAGTTAAEMLVVTHVSRGETILIHGASGATGISAVQQAVAMGVRVIGTASATNHDVLRGFGAIPVAYGSGLEARVRAMAPGGVDAALDAAGTEEAVAVSLALATKERIISIAGGHAPARGIRFITGADPVSTAFRQRIRPHVVALVERGALTVPMAGTYPLTQANRAIEIMQGGHPGGKLALLP